MAPNHQNFITFTNVPDSSHLDVPWEFQCLSCGKANQTPFEVNTCVHQLCGPCWQKSAYDLGDFENKCLVCHEPTNLTCFKDYITFVGFNFYNGDLILPVIRLKDRLKERQDDVEKNEVNDEIAWISPLFEAYLTHQITVLEAIQKNIKKKFTWKNYNGWNTKSIDGVRKRKLERIDEDEETQFNIKDKSSKLVPQTPVKRRLGFQARRSVSTDI